jgi:hypothetical protein
MEVIQQWRLHQTNIMLRKNIEILHEMQQTLGQHNRKDVCHQTLE